MIAWVAIPSGTYQVGSPEVLNNPARSVELKQFEISKYEVTNYEFAQFVSATGYRTDAEVRHNAQVFEPGLKEFRWKQDPTANWHYPNGRRNGGIQSKLNHPVTCISFRDAQAYCAWARVRLPSLDEWEVAARAGTTGRWFCEPSELGQYANIWHLRDHLKPDTTDGFMTTSPVGTFKPNPLGLYDIYGNVFEFCTGRTPTNRSKTKRHARGGSWWCSQNSCCFYNSVDVGGANERASFSNQGFRVARDIKAR